MMMNREDSVENRHGMGKTKAQKGIRTATAECGMEKAHQ